jgi:predicted Rossmann fold flavoprotein
MEKPGRKIRISGKGRCNLTNTRSHEEFLEKVRTGREFFGPAFRNLDNHQTVRFFRKQGLQLEVERGERVFPRSGKAWDVANTLAGWCKDLGVKLEVRTSAEEIVLLGGKIYGVTIRNRGGFQRRIECSNVILCTGGASYPATGSTGDGYTIAHALGHKIVDIRPALVPLEGAPAIVQQLNGLQLKNVGLRLEIDGEIAAEEFGEMDFGSRGLEGAVILRVSRDAVDALIDGRQVRLLLDLKPALDRETLLERMGRERAALPEVARFGELVRKLAPKQLVEPLAVAAGVRSDMRMHRVEEAAFGKLADALKCFALTVSDYRPFEEAVVTAGGVSTDEVDPQTMQSRIVPGLYFAGELLDVDADTGGYNMQIAFSTGYLAGELRK